MPEKNEKTPTISFGETGLPSLGGFDAEPTRTGHTETIAVVLAAHARERPVLVVAKGIDAGRVIAIGRSELTIGRGDECVLALADRGVSHCHARIVRADAGSAFVLEDLQSKNGTFVDGVAVKEPRQLAVGDSFQIGPDVIVRLTMMTDAEEKAARQLYTSSMCDALTLTFNFRYMARRLKSELAYAERHKTPLSVMVLNFDRFRMLNDGHGQATGDAVLQQLTKTVQGELRTEDVLGRLDSQEFGILLRGIDEKGVLSCAERVRVAVEKASLPTQRLCAVTVSVGVATNSESATTGERLFELASARLRVAKTRGRNLVCGPEAVSSRTPAPGQSR